MSSVRCSLPRRTVTPESLQPLADPASLDGLSPTGVTYIKLATHKRLYKLALCNNNDDNNNNNNDEDDYLSTSRCDDSGGGAVFVLLITTMNPSRDTKISPCFLYWVRTLGICESSRYKESQIQIEQM